MKRNWLTIAGMALGLVIACVMAFANQLGLDNNTAWGAKRYILFFLGIFIFFALLFYRQNNFIGRLIHTRQGRLILGTSLAFSPVILVYVWYATLGSWTTIPPTTNYYDLLATSFSHGQLALETQPDPALLALDDPYDPANRKGIFVIWDASLYKGKYYLYWGPAPSLLLALIKPFHPNEIGDNLLTLIFIAGTFLFQTLILLDLYKNNFQETPLPAIVLSVIVAGLINPALFMLVDPRIYEAAVAAGQFFFIGGLYFLFTVFQKPNAARLAIAGTMFTLAVGSRTILVLPIAFLSIIILIWVLKNQRDKTILFVSTFALPLIFGAVGYAWYNFARFGSIAEFGYAYQLTGFNIHANIKDAFSLSYIPPNLYKTIINPFEFKDIFPYIHPTLWSGPTNWFKIYNPKIYYYLAESITGLLMASPILIFIFIRNNKRVFWNSISLAGSSLLIFFSLQIFFYATMRYLMDLTPALAILAIIGIWSGFEFLKEKRAARFFYTALAFVLWAYTIAVSSMLAFSSNLKRFKEFNPDSIQQLANFFDRIFK